MPQTQSRKSFFLPSISPFSHNLLSLAHSVQEKLFPMALYAKAPEFFLPTSIPANTLEMANTILVERHVVLHENVQKKATDTLLAYCCPLGCPP